MRSESIVPRSRDVDELKRCINSERAALRRTVIECAVEEWHNVYALVFVLEGTF